ncbi:MAG: hypothetical protein AAB657_03000 [Patescibacteria group bacterium]
MKDVWQTIFRAVYPHQDPVSIKREYGLPNQINLQVQISADGWFVVTSPDLPGLVTQARSQSELIEMVNDAVLTYFDVPKTKADIVYDQFNLGGELVQYQGQLQTKTI